ncbi:MAG: 4a-hydroxytetrahydrobiopterin dehydratase [Nitrospirae bacterium]|nr:4a-hydroxytetrahydrobiopterin dehydratase [Nitrospirota bacterium]MBI3594801.1 4a-hydroxytetrahydrobiopterin dehydratase [Nitrospirota bacterium]
MPLNTKKCVPCRGGIPPLKQEEAEKLLLEIPDWVLKKEPDRIERKFYFSDFASALRFVSQVGELAEAEGHHPDLTLGWGYSVVTFYTHKIKGLHENDFIMAAKVNLIRETKSN